MSTCALETLLSLPMLGIGYNAVFHCLVCVVRLVLTLSVTDAIIFLDSDALMRFGYIVVVHCYITPLGVILH